MQRRLLSVPNVSAHIVEKLYPKLLAYAGESMYAAGVAAALELEINAYCNQVSPHMLPPLMERLPEIVEALVRDRRVKSEIMQILRQSSG
jgi:hypothetical protein